MPGVRLGDPALGSGAVTMLPTSEAQIVGVVTLRTSVSAPELDNDGLLTRQVRASSLLHL